MRETRQSVIYRNAVVNKTQSLPLLNGEAYMNHRLLFTDKQNCCGCGACLNVCAKHAIKMEEDEYGFVYPRIDDSLCVHCGMCSKVCDFQNNVVQDFEPQEVYAASAKDREVLFQSSSGGIFALLAHKVLNDGGVVFGAAYVESGESISVEHIRVDNNDDLYKLQGSKYVQSNIGEIYTLVKSDLIENRSVLFSGTPCQVAGLRSYLNKEYNNLYTVDIVCHGVPSQKLFHSMIKYYEHQFKGHIRNFSFREKRRGWTDYYALIDVDIKGISHKKHIYCKNMAYYQYFLQAVIFRENCYACKYAKRNRVSDITLGDYWGIETAHPSLFNDNSWRENLNNGISCVLANTSKGISLLNSVKELACFEKSNYECVSRQNGQLRESSKQSPLREEILKQWMKTDYRTIQNDYKHNEGWHFYYIKVRKAIAPTIKRVLHWR